MITTAYINIWGQRVGAVAWNPNSGLASFEYDPGFLQSGWDLSPIKMPRSSGHQIFSFPEIRTSSTSHSDTFRGLPGLLADSLPDRYGNQLTNAWLARNGRPQNSLNPVEQLCFIGTRGMGALEFEPSIMAQQKKPFVLEVEGLVDAARMLLKKRDNFKTHLQEDDMESVKDILKVGTSAGGARPKAIIAYNQSSGEVRSGQTIAPVGFEHYLLKLDGVSGAQFGNTMGYGRVEMAYYRMALDCGIEMMESHLFEENGRAHFLTKRFDREGGNIRHHIQTLCAIQHYDFNEVQSYSYEQLFQTMRILRLPYPQGEQLFRRMVFNVLARNCDDHTKNFAFRMEKDHPWELAPAYDICHAYRPGSDWVSQQSLSINGKRTGITDHDMESLAQNMNIKKAGRIIHEIRQVVSSWNGYAEELKVNTKLRNQIAATLLA